MKKLNITKEQFNRSRYFQEKYGTLEYVSESGKVFKTDKGKVLMFKESVIDSTGRGDYAKSDSVKVADKNNAKSIRTKDERYIAEKEVMQIWKDWVAQNGLEDAAFGDSYGFNTAGVFWDINDGRWCVKALLGEDAFAEQRQWNKLKSMLKNCQGFDGVVYEDDDYHVLCFYWAYEPLGGKVIPFDERFDGAITRNDYEEYIINSGI